MTSQYRKLVNSVVGIIILMIAGLGASSAHAECSLSITGPGANSSLGMIVAGSSATTFSIPVSGPVTQTPGLSGGGSLLIRPPSSFHLNVQILGGSTCPDIVTVTVSTLGNKFITSNTSLQISDFSGMNNVSITSGSTIPNGGSFTFSFSGGGLGGNASFSIGQNIGLPASPSAGSAGWTTTISVAG